MTNKIKVKNDEDFQGCIDGHGDPEYEFELVEEGEWTQDYKYQNKETILRRKGDDTFWLYFESRTGSPFSDWHCESYGDEEVTLTQVEAVEVTRIEWQPIDTGA